MNEKKKAAPDPVAATSARVLAVLDADGVLIGRVDNPSDEQWAKAKPELRFVNGFDNALHRYRLAEWAPGRWRFDAVVHAKDKTKENHEIVAEIVSPLVRSVLAIADDKNPAANDVNALRDFLKTFDAKGA